MCWWTNDRHNKLYTDFGKNGWIERHREKGDRNNARERLPTEPIHCFVCTSTTHTIKMETTNRKIMLDRVNRVNRRKPTKAREKEKIEREKCIDKTTQPCNGNKGKKLLHEIQDGNNLDHRRRMAKQGTGKKAKCLQKTIHWLFYDTMAHTKQCVRDYMSR